MLNFKLQREQRVYRICPQKRIYQRQAVFFAVWCQYFKKPWLSILEEYDRFDLDELGNDQCKAEIRFYKNDIFKLAEYLQLPDEIVPYNGLVVGLIPALCIYLKRFTYPCRYGRDIVAHFARPVPELCILLRTTRLTGSITDGVTYSRGIIMTCFSRQILCCMLIRYIDQAQLWKTAEGLLMEQCGQCVGQEKTREPFIIDIKVYIP